MTPQTIHIVTGEYPPDRGGVSDYTAQIAAGLGHAEWAVHIWAPGYSGARREDGVCVHRSAGELTWTDLRRVGCDLDTYPQPRRLLVQWTPHAYGRRAMNLAFPAWLWTRAHQRHDRVDLMAHEAGCAFGEGWRQNAVATAHRLMLAILLDSVSSVQMSIPAWEPRLRPWAWRRNPSFSWLPIPSNLAVGVNADDVHRMRQRLTPKGEHLVGHFGNFGDAIARLLRPALCELIRQKDVKILLAGYGSDTFHEQFIAAHPEAAEHLMASGPLPAHEAAASLAACDVMLQPYPDGVSTRRGTAMAALALGLPIVTNLGSLSEQLWKIADAVELALSPHDLALTVLALLGNAARRSQLSANAHRLYDARFALQHTIAALTGVPG